MFKWTRDKLLVLGVVVVLFGAELLVVQHVVLTREATIFVAKQTNHPDLAAAQTIQDLTGSNDHIKPLQCDVWVWWGRLMSFVGLGIIVRNYGKN